VVRGQPGEIVLKLLSQNTHHKKRADEVAQVVERLLSKGETLSSTLSTAKGEKNKI
jgi:hypothetical protein